MVTPESNQNDMHFDLNLVPFIDVLSTCICFLLMTAVWIHIGAFNVSQALGDSTAADKNPPSVIVQMKNGGDLELSLKDVASNRGLPQVMTVSARGNNIDWQELITQVARLHAAIPDLKTALVMPSEHAKYDNVIRVMDLFRKNEIKQIGLAPLGGS